jgi:hypothetical protein
MGSGGSFFKQGTFLPVEDEVGAQVGQVNVQFGAGGSQVRNGGHVLRPASLLVQLTLVYLGHGGGVDEVRRPLLLQHMLHLRGIGDVEGHEAQLRV